MFVTQRNYFESVSIECACVYDMRAFISLNPNFNGSKCGTVDVTHIR